MKDRAGSARHFLLAFSIVVALGVLIWIRVPGTGPAAPSSVPASNSVATLPVPAGQSSAPNSAHANVDEAFPGISSSLLKEPKQYLLTGTVVGANAREGQAFLGIDAKNPQTYSAGATLANGATLLEVARDHVVITRDGRTAKIWLQSLGRAPEGAKQLTQVGGEQSFIAAKSNNTEVYTDFIRPNPVYDGNALVGYEVYPGRQSSIFYRLGLAPGDVITAFDGQPLSSPEAVMASMQALADGAGLVVTIKRKGKVEEHALDGSVVVTETQKRREVASGAAPDRPPI